jgi:hypothetical protein
MNKEDKLPCGHDRKYFYFHPALRNGARFRCAKCDDPNCNTRFMQELKAQEAREEPEYSI